MLFARHTQPLGDVYSDAATLIASAPGFIHDAVSIIDAVGPYMTTVRHVLEDPALPAVLARIEVIRGLEESGLAGPAPVGVGLHRLIFPLDAYIWIRKNPVPIVVGAGALLLLLLRTIKQARACGGR